MVMAWTRLAAPLPMMPSLRRSPAECPSSPLRGAWWNTAGDGIPPNTTGRGYISLVTPVSGVMPSSPLRGAWRNTGGDGFRQSTATGEQIDRGAARPGSKILGPPRCRAYG